MWWIREILQKNLHMRPFIMSFYASNNTEVSGVMFKNSPYYHIVPLDCINMYFHDFEIFVDIWGQLELHRLFGHTYHTEKTDILGTGLSIELPTFPLNTDGIDIWA